MNGKSKSRRVAQGIRKAWSMVDSDLGRLLNECEAVITHRESSNASHTTITFEKLESGQWRASY